jgi:hypothetical protein
MRVGSAWTTAGASLLLAAVVSSCGGSSDEADVDAGASFQQTEPGLPVGEVLVGEDTAWVVGSQGDTADDIDIWRLEPGTAEPELVGTVEPLQGASHAVAPVDGAAGGEGVELAGWSCVDGELADCDAGVAELVRVDAAGDVTDEVTLAEKDGPLDPSDSVAIVGTTAASTWVAVDESVVEVGASDSASDSASGEVLATVPSSWGEHCVIGDRLYGLVDPNVPAPGAVVTDSQQATDVVPSFQVKEPADVADSGDWEVVAGGASGDFEPGEALVGFCGDGRFEVTTPDGDLVATWTPDAGWVRAAASADQPAEADVEGESAEGTFVVLDDGAVVERAGDGDYEPTGLDLPAPAGFDPASGPVVVSADASDSLVAACVTWPETPETATTTCDLTRR